MQKDTPPALLFARMQSLAPNARSFLIAAPRSTPAFPSVTKELARVANELGIDAQLVDLCESGPSAAVEVARSSDAEVEGGSENSTHAPVNLRLISGAGILDHAATLRHVALVDAVVLVVQRGKSTREDLNEVNREVKQAGGRIIGVVLQT